MEGKEKKKDKISYILYVLTIFIYTFIFIGGILLFVSFLIGTAFEDNGKILLDQKEVLISSATLSVVVSAYIVHITNKIDTNKSKDDKN